MSVPITTVVTVMQPIMARMSSDMPAPEQGEQRSERPTHCRCVAWCEVELGHDLPVANHANALAWLLPLLAVNRHFDYSLSLANRVKLASVANGVESVKLDAIGCAGIFRDRFGIREKCAVAYGVAADAAAGDLDLARIVVLIHKFSRGRRYGRQQYCTAISWPLSRLLSLLRSDKDHSVMSDNRSPSQRPGKGFSSRSGRQLGPGRGGQPRRNRLRSAAPFRQSPVHPSDGLWDANRDGSRSESTLLRRRSSGRSLAGFSGVVRRSAPDMISGS